MLFLCGRVIEDRSQEVENLAMGTMTGLLYASPMMFLGIWAPLKCTSVIRELIARNVALVPSALSIPEHDKD